MDAKSLNFLRYIQTSLADAANLTPSIKEDSVVEITSDELGRGILGEHARKRLLDFARTLARFNSGAQMDEDRLWPIRVIVLPLVYGLRPSHGARHAYLPPKFAPLMLFARLGRDGTLTPEERNEGQAVLSRDLLEPNRQEISIGLVEDADRAYAKQQDRADAWPDLMRKGVAIMEDVCGTSYETFAIDPYERLAASYVLISDSVSSTYAIQKLVNLLQSENAPKAPLFDAIVTEAQDRELLALDQQIALSKQHLGQMECRYGLSASQREALMHHLVGASGPDVLAVDGPPGTGKTTLLLSIIATLWVKHALAQTEAPIIVATSTNNQAITNILRTFSEVKEPEGPLSGRWLNGLESYGLYLPAKTQTETFKFSVHELREAGRGFVFDAQRFESKVGLDTARTAFLQHFKEAFTLSGDVDLTEAISHLHRKLQDEEKNIIRVIDALQAIRMLIEGSTISDDAILQCREQLQLTYDACAQGVTTSDTRLQAARQLDANWKQHVVDEPFWTNILAAIGFKQRRHNRDQAFCARVALAPDVGLQVSFGKLSLRSEIESSIESSQRQAHDELARAQRSIAAAMQRLGQLTTAVGVLQPLIDDKPLMIDAIEAALDVGPRYTAFKLATHYWEARYLLELQTHFRRYETIIDSKSPERRLAQYRRLAKLHPCFVATLYTLPNKFIAYPTPSEPVPLCDAIDLLIVDEAGQVSPEIGAPSFALAKRAVVVGDVDQIEPITIIPGHIDGANALHSGVVASAEALSAFRESGLGASNGSFMRMAQRATPYAKYPDRGRGLFLSEHRRCWPEIIRMCNVLVYGGRLRPCREDNGARAILPSVGYVHIPGHARSRGGSRDNPTEAAAIAQWLALRKPFIEAAYPGKPMSELVAVITPFSAQSRRIRSALSEALGSGHDLTVGTVHALQGAERRVVIFSSTYGLGTEPGDTFIDRSRSMLNVAISRAQDAFMVFGNMHLFRPVGSHPCAVIGQMLFGEGGNEIQGIPAELLVPGQDMSPGRLIADLNDHRAVLQEALSTAQRQLVIVSPFLSEAAIAADDVQAGIRAAVQRGVEVRVVSDPDLSTYPMTFKRCVQRLEAAGAVVRVANTQGVHSKLLLVDRAWLVVGSFNWLSAVRDAGSGWARYESSLRYDGHEAFEMITKSLRDLAEVVNPQRATG